MKLLKVCYCKQIPEFNLQVHNKDGLGSLEMLEPSSLHIKRTVILVLYMERVLIKFYTVAKVIVDRETGRSKGFGFITYTSNEDASSALQALDGQVI